MDEYGVPAQGERMRFLDSLRARGCRPFLTENCPLDSFPGVRNLEMTQGRKCLRNRFFSYKIRKN